MKAIQYPVYGDADVMGIAEVDDPVPGPGQVLIDIHAASVNPVDWKIRSGAMRQFFDVEFPVIPGRDGAGVIAALGADVSPEASGVSVGDEVCFIAGHMGQGTYAERIVLDAEAVAPKGANISFAEAAAFPLAGMTAWAAVVKTAPIEFGMKVLIHSGSGGVGGIAIQLAKHFEAAEIAATCSAANVDAVLALGATRAIAYDEEDFAEVLNDVDLVFDTYGGDVHRRSYEVMRMGGTMVYITAQPVKDLSQQYGVTTVQAPVRPDHPALKELAALVAAGEVKPQVGQVLPLAEAAKAHRISETGHVRGKLVLEIR